MNDWVNPRTLVVAVWKRFLPVAINPPFNYSQYAYDYADRLRLDKQYREAAGYYGRVPAGDPRHASAKYFQMVSMFSLLFDTKAENGRKVPAVQGPERQQPRSSWSREPSGCRPRSPAR